MQPEVAPKKHHLLFAIIPALFVAAVGVIVAITFPRQTQQTTKNDNAAPLADEKRKGIAMVPRTKDTPKFNELFKVAPELGGVVTWTGDWGELSKPTSGAKALVAAAKQYDFTPVVLVTLHNNTSPSKLLRPLTPELMDQYAKDAAEFVGQNPLGYFGMGVEINNLENSDKAQYQEFVQLFNKAADAVKKESPTTKVFTVFQLERMKGLNGGLFGGSNNENANTWELVNDFSKADVIGFTSYPYLIYKTPSEIPDDYYSAIPALVNKPVIFTEIGWPSRVEAAGWDSSPTLQAKFVDRFFELTKTVDPKLIIWPFAYDPPANHPFSSVGLSEVDGQHKPAWDKWVSITY